MTKIKKLPLPKFKKIRTPKVRGSKYDEHDVYLDKIHLCTISESYLEDFVDALNTYNGMAKYEHDYKGGFDIYYRDSEEDGLVLDISDNVSKNFYIKNVNVKYFKVIQSVILSSDPIMLFMNSYYNDHNVGIVNLKGSRKLDRVIKNLFQEFDKNLEIEKIDKLSALTFLVQKAIVKHEKTYLDDILEPTDEKTMHKQQKDFMSFIGVINLADVRKNLVEQISYLEKDRPANMWKVHR